MEVVESVVCLDADVIIEVSQHLASDELDLTFLVVLHYVVQGYF